MRYVFFICKISFGSKSIQIIWIWLQQKAWILLDLDCDSFGFTTLPDGAAGEGLLVGLGLTLVALSHSLQSNKKHKQKLNEQ